MAPEHRIGGTFIPPDAAGQRFDNGEIRFKLIAPVV
jgi:hypothetical protein